MIPQIVYCLWCLFWAYANHRAIDFANERIFHAVNGLVHLAVCIYFGIQIHWMIGLTMFFEGRLLFDTSLNLFRGLSIGYVPVNPKAITDKLEKKVFGKDGVTPKVLYFVIIIALNILYEKTTH